jgi:hypothetical protein
MRSVLMVTLIVGAMVIGGCAHSAKDIDESKVDPVCAQRCSISYSKCTSGMNMMSSPLMSKCNEAYDACMGSCPAK